MLHQSGFDMMACKLFDSVREIGTTAEGQEIRHVVKQFGHKLLDETKNVYRCTIMLERSTSQKPFAEVLRLPRPSQVDDWNLYKKLLGEEYRTCEGETAFEKWADLEEEQQTEKEQFIKASALKEGIDGIHW